MRRRNLVRGEEIRMATRIGAVAAASMILALAACGKPETTSEQPANTAAAAPAPAPTPLTDAQKKSLLAELPSAYQSTDLANGEAKAAVCGVCHTLTQGGADG